MRNFSIFPFKIDFWAVFIFLGVVQAVILSIFFLTKKEGNRPSNRLAGLILFSLSLIGFEILLFYTGYIQKLLFLADFSEPLNFVVGPLFYLFVYFRVTEERKFRPVQYFHFLPFFIYSLYAVFFFMQDSEVKFNEFLGDMHPEVPPIPEQIVFNQDPFLLKRGIDELFLLQLFIYSLMTIWLLSKTFKKRHLSFFSNADRRYSWLRNFSLAILFFLLIKLIQLAFFQRDLGDYIAAVFITLLVYGMSFTVIKRSSLFSDTLVSRAQKYEKSSLIEESKQRIKKRLEQVMKEEKPYLDYSLSLPSLAKRIRISPHHLSQVLNDCLNRNFYSYIADFRIQEAQQILVDPAQANIKLEEVAEMVGYNSKPAFNAAFKKLTGMTPSEFRKSRINKSPNHSNR